MTSWSLVFSLPSGGTLGSLWDATDTVAGSTVTVTSSAGSSLAAGGSTTVGFEIDGSDLNPSACSVDGTSQCTIPVKTGGAGGAASCTSLPGTPGSVPFAPYADVTLYPQVSLTNTACAAGTREFTLAFFTGSGCTPTLAGASYQNPTLLADIKQLRALGGDVIGSFGGENGQELAQSCTNVTQLAAAYRSVVDYYGLRQIDFDVEGGAVADTASITRRSQAVAALQSAEAAAGTPVSVSLTLPVLPQGLPQDELNVIGSAVTAGVTVSVVNVMAMDYGDSPAPSPAGKMGTYAIDAGTATEAQLAAIYPHATAAQLWAMVGVTPMIGQNDADDEVFTAADAAQLASWASSHGVGRLSMWSSTRDAACPGGADYAAADCSGVTQAPWDFSKALLAG